MNFAKTSKNVAPEPLWAVQIQVDFGLDFGSIFKKTSKNAAPEPLSAVQIRVDFGFDFGWIFC